MTLFEPDVRPLPRSRNPVPRADEKPKWNKYTAKARQRCDECMEIAYETMPGPMPGIADARFSRRQAGKTRLYCYGHASAQRAEDRETYGMRLEG